MTEPDRSPRPDAREGYAWRDVGPPAKLSFDPGHVVQFDDIKRRVAVFELEEGGYAAVDDICPHAGASLGDGWRRGDTVACPLHGWEFDLRTGACPYGDEWSAEAFSTRVADDGVVQVLVGRRGGRQPG